MSLLDEISKLTTPASALPDLEDDDHDGTSARKLASSLPKAKFVDSNFEEGKYAGKKVSRKDLFGDMSEMSGISNQKDSDSENEEDEEDEEEEESGDDDGEVDENENGVDKMGNGFADSDEEKSDDDDQDLEDEDEDDDGTENSGITKITLANESLTSSNKAECIQNQRKVWDDIMYTNIRMHALLNASNQLPRGDARKQMMQSSDEKTKENMTKALKNMGKLRQLLKEACGLFSEKVVDDDDEEIPSDEEIGDLNSEGEDDDEDVDDEDGDEGEESDEDNTNATKSIEQGVSADKLSKFLKQHDEEFDKFRGTTITKWYNRTKLLNSKSTNSADFSVFEKGSVLSQINKILSDESKFVKKVRTNRSGKSRIGVEAEQDGMDDEIFDDSDFYQILLKQMIESRSSNVNTAEDGADMTRSYMELQKMFNNKKKRDVTSLSSKDRRLKYEPIAKLINFFPAKPSVVTWSHESRNELFKSLFS